METGTLLEVKGLKKYFDVGGGKLFSREKTYVRAVDDVTFEMKKGETLGVVGESGCGKSTMGRAILRLHEPTAGTILFKGEDITDIDKNTMRSKRKEMQIIFQDPYGSLNPRMTVGAMLMEIVRTHRIVPEDGAMDYVIQVLEEVGLKPEHFYRYPHEFSGGQRQRVGIARALVVNPELIVCDEAVSALDVSVQSQVLNLLQKLKKEHHLTYLFISHDLSVVKYISNRVAVMYLGKIVELADKKALFEKPLHPYTQALLSAIPVPDPEAKRERILLSGDVPSPLNIPPGCPFHTRCPEATDVCKREVPEFRDAGEQHFVACHLHA